MTANKAVSLDTLAKARYKMSGYFNSMIKDGYFNQSQEELERNLAYLVESSAEECFSSISPEVDERLLYECHKILKLGIAKRFLLAKEITVILQNLDCKTPYCIGNACGSLVSYVLGISEVNPLEQGLLFERAFSKHGLSCFSFYVNEDDKQKLLEALESRYAVAIRGNEYQDTLSINGVDVCLLKSLDSQDDYIITKSRVAVYQEDYMRLLHFVGGYDYEETEYIRRISSKLNMLELKRYQDEFVAHYEGIIPKKEAELLLVTIFREIRYATCKAYVISVKEMLTSDMPF